MSAPAPGPRVHLLPDGLINKIAAGEVVERPASVVKELVENALDAGATRIEVDVEGGGRGLIRVRDDGSGMGRQDALACLQRHATSKIRTDDDLFSIASFGFRGEAIPSIAEVSRFELRTGEGGAEVGTRVQVDAGVIEAIEDAANPGGTEVAVRRLFVNTPARLKFLKSDRSELGHIVEGISRVALAHPGVAIRLASEGRVVHDLPAAETLRARVEALLGRAVAEGLRDLTEREGDLALEGLVSTPSMTRTSAAGLHLFVNGRFVRDRAVTGAVLAAYRDLLPRGRYPVAILFLDLPLDRVDVNVHPQKIEVRFRDARAVWRFVTAALSRRLQALGGVLDAPGGARQSGLFDARAVPGRSALGPSPSPAPFRVSPAREGAGPRMTGAQAAALLDRALLPAREPTAAPRPPAPADSARASFAAPRAPVLLGAHAGFLVVAEGDELLLVDQHAARRLLLWDALSQTTEDAPAPTRRLLVPALLDLAPAEARALEALGPVLEPLGVELSAFGSDTAALHSLSPDLDAGRASELLAALRDLARDGPRDPSARRREAALLVSGFVRSGSASDPRDELLDLVGRLRARRGPLPSGLAPGCLALDAEGLRRLLRRGAP